MYARTTTVCGDPQAMDEGIGYVRDSVWPTLQRMSGCVGLSMLTDRDAGRCIVTSAWAADEAMRASAEMVREVRHQTAEVLRADTVLIEEWEIAAMHRMHATGDGACARVIWAQCEPGQLDAMIDAFRMSLQPRFEDLPGFCSVSLMVDRNTGRTSAAITYESRNAMDRSREQGAAMREEFAGAMHSMITEVADFDVALAHLRVPEMA
jgi:heme-degrading monooxygenase HmoA